MTIYKKVCIRIEVFPGQAYRPEYFCTPVEKGHYIARLTGYIVMAYIVMASWRRGTRSQG